MTLFLKFILCILVSCTFKPITGSSEYVDLSYVIDENAYRHPNGQSYTWDILAKGYIEGNLWHEEYSFCMGEHTGTHLNAPSHLAYKQWTVDEIPLNRLVGPGFVVDVRDKVESDPNYKLSTDDLLYWIDTYGPLQNGTIVFIHTGWAASRYGNYTEYFGTTGNDKTKMKFPGISKGAAQLLIEYENLNGNQVVGVGIDGPSIDPASSAMEAETQRALYESNIYGLENVANLDKLPTDGFQVTVMPMKLRAGSGSPVRILATLPASDASDRIMASSILIVSLYITCFGI